jgi:hypothetical protein
MFTIIGLTVLYFVIGGLVAAIMTQRFEPTGGSDDDAVVAAVFAWPIFLVVYMIMVIFCRAIPYTVKWIAKQLPTFKWGKDV